MNSNLEFRDGSTQRWVRLADLSLGGTRNGLYKPKEFHGSGAKIVNMGELFAFPRLANEEMKRIEVTQDELDRFGLQAGDLLFARRSLVADGAGKCSIVVHCDAPTVFESSIIRLRPARERVEPEYLFYLFRSSVGDQLLDRIRKRDAVSGITGKDLAALEVPLPAKEVQRNVCDLLSTLDNRIDHNQALAANLEAIARRLFKSWFVDFDPVRAKADGEKPSGLADDIAVLFPDRFVESELGEIPEGWAFNPLSSIAEFVNGRNFTKDATGTGRMIIRIAELSNGGPTGSTVWNDLPRTAEQYLANPGNILFAWSGSLGIHVWDRNTGLVNQHIFKVIPKPPFAAPFVFFATEDLVDDFRAIAAGKAVTMGHIKRNDLDTHGVTCPSAPELITAFHKIVAPLWDRVRVARREALTLGSIRDLLLPRLISGKLRVEDVVSLVEETIA